MIKDKLKILTAKLRHFKRPSVRVAILAGFAVFTVVIVSLLWVFQISLLNTFYGFIKENEVRSEAETVINNLDSSDLSTVLLQISRDTGIDVIVTDSKGIELASVQSMHSGLFQRFTPLNCAAIYIETEANGGEIYEKYHNNDYTITRTQAELENGATGYAISGSKPMDSKRDDIYNIVYIRTVTTNEGNERLVVLNASITPVDSTVDTLKVQLWCLTVVMIIMAFILAMFISGKISGPIRDMSDSAKILAQGDYNIVFAEKGSKETVELAETLNFAAKELSKVDVLRRELIANVSHDLRTPLTMIAGYSEVMRDIPGENTPENVQVIIDETTRLTNLVNDLLDLSKLESGKMSIDPKRMNLTAGVGEIMKRYDKLADYSFDFYHGDDVYVYADELKISQVVYNLVNNAINYSGEDKTITVRQEVLGDKVRISVTDTGEGIPEDKIKDIWERYYKVDKQHKRAQVGTGLGLSIVKNILELHGGDYGVVSTEGSGSTFWFSLAIMKDEAPALPEEV